MSIKSVTREGVASIEIARAEKKNALTTAMYQALAEAITAAGSDDAVRALLIFGQPDIFTAGNDLEDFSQRPPDSEHAPVVGFMRALAHCAKPVVAAVTGTAVGVGVTLLLHCDLVYVSEGARLSMPFTSLGLVPEFASSLLLPRRVGQAKAAELLLLGESFSAEDAVRLGLANAVLPAAQVLSHARSMAERFNTLPPDAVRHTKRLLRAELQEPIERVLHAEALTFMERLHSPEARAAFAAFLRKRRPDAKG
jgi:enoyl-CoA hydratase/carnithine racemase